MQVSSEYNGNPDDFALFVKKLPENLMFLIDARPNKDQKVVYRSMSNEIEWSFIRRHQPNHSKPEFKISIEGDNWGSLNRQLFDDIPALAHALRKRGLTQVEF